MKKKLLTIAMLLVLCAGCSFTLFTFDVNVPMAGRFELIGRYHASDWQTNAAGRVSRIADMFGDSKRSSRDIEFMHDGSRVPRRQPEPLWTNEYGAAVVPLSSVESDVQPPGYDPPDEVPCPHGAPHPSVCSVCQGGE